MTTDYICVIFKVKLFKRGNNKNLIFSVPHFLIFEALNVHRWWATLGTCTFWKEKQERLPHLAPACILNKQKEKRKCMSKSPVYKLVPGATWICGRRSLKGLVLLFTLMYNKEREWWQASITWYTWYATAQSQHRLAFCIPFFFFFFLLSYAQIWLSYISYFPWLRFQAFKTSLFSWVPSLSQ